MTRRLFSYICGILLIMMQLNHALTLKEIEAETSHHYDDAFDRLPEKQQNILMSGQQAWQRYRNLRCEIHARIYQGDNEQCKILLTYRYNILLKILRPNQIDLIHFFNNHIAQSTIEFQAQQPKNDNSFDANMNQKLNHQYLELYQSLEFSDQILLQKSYVAWLSYQNQMCLLLNSRNLIAYNYCAAKLSLDIISDMHNYLKY